MCDINEGKLIVGVPKGPAGEIAIARIRDRAVPGCSHIISMFDRLSGLGIDPSLLADLPTRLHLLGVSPGEENYISNWLVHNFNGHNHQTRRGIIEFAQPDFALYPTSSSGSTSNKDFDPDPTMHDKYQKIMNVDKAHANYHRGDGVIVCVLDTGLANTSVAKHKVQANDSYDFINDAPGLPDDNYGHGSAVGWIINRIAPEAELRILKVLDPGVTIGSEWDTLAAINSAYAMGADMMNLSLEFGLPDKGPCSKCCHRASHSSRSAAFQRTLMMITDPRFSTTGKQPIIIAATGNSNNHLPSYPARFSEVVAVGSINASRWRSNFSNYGATQINFFVAPGGDDPHDANSEYIGRSKDKLIDHAGTSMACAYATGMLAIYKSAHPSLDNADLLKEARNKASHYIKNFNSLEHGQGVIYYDYQQKPHP